MTENGRQIVTSHLENERGAFGFILPVHSEPWMNESSVMNSHFANRLVARFAINGHTSWQAEFFMGLQNIEMSMLNVDEPIPEFDTYLSMDALPIIGWIWFLVFV